MDQQSPQGQEQQATEGMYVQGHDGRHLQEQGCDPGLTVPLALKHPQIMTEWPGTTT